MKKNRLPHLLGSLFVLAVFAVAAWWLRRELVHHDVTLQRIRDSIFAIRTSYLVIALGLTIINYGILVFFDYLAFRYAKVPISLARVAFAALTSYPVSYNFGATLAGVPLRYRLYSSWGIPLTKIVQLLVILALTFWFGVFFISGVLFLFVPLRIPAEQLQLISQALSDKVPADVVRWFTFLFSDSRLFGIVLLVLTGMHVGASLFHRGSVKIFRWTLPVPPFRLTIYQIAIASADMLVAGSVLYMLFPPVQGGYLTVLEAYLVVYVLIVLSHVPGGWGVLEAGMMALLGSLKLVPDPHTNMLKVFAGILIFRVIYFLLPLLFAAAMIGWHEYALRKNWIPPVVAGPDGTADGESQPEGLNGHAVKNGTAETKRHVPSE